MQLSKYQKSELDKRLASYQLNPDNGSPWQGVKARILSKEKNIQTIRRNKLKPAFLEYLDKVAGILGTKGKLSKILLAERAKENSSPEIKNLRKWKTQ